MSFQISLNDKEWGDFGDAVVQVELKEADNPTNFTHTFAIQFKDICSNVKHIESLTEGDLSLLHCDFFNLIYFFRKICGTQTT